jgi:hypothetical protein
MAIKTMPSRMAPPGSDFFSVIISSFNDRT